MRKAFLAVGLALGVGVVVVVWGRVIALAGVTRVIKRKLPDVEWISAEELARWRSDPNRAHPVLGDCRTVEEYSVSHLEGALRIDPDTPDVSELVRSLKGASVVVYCSVGYRSAYVARRLRQAGAQRVFNLEGSLFRWANEGRPLVGVEGPTRLVHPYNEAWGRLLSPNHRAPASRIESGLPP